MRAKSRIPKRGAAALPITQKLEAEARALVLRWYPKLAGRPDLLERLVEEVARGVIEDLKRWEPFCRAAAAAARRVEEEAFLKACAPFGERRRYNPEDHAVGWWRKFLIRLGRVRARVKGRCCYACRFYRDDGTNWGECVSYWKREKFRGDDQPFKLFVPRFYHCCFFAKPSE